LFKSKKDQIKHISPKFSQKMVEMELKLENKELDYDKVQSLIDLYKVIIYE